MRSQGKRVGTRGRWIRRSLPDVTANQWNDWGLFGSRKGERLYDAVDVATRAAMNLWRDPEAALAALAMWSAPASCSTRSTTSPTRSHRRQSRPPRCCACAVSSYGHGRTTTPRPIPITSTPAKGLTMCDDTTTTKPAPRTFCPSASCARESTSTAPASVLLARSTGRVLAAAGGHRSRWPRDGFSVCRSRRVRQQYVRKPR